MAATPAQLEAIKLIGDWSKWIAAIETGAIAVIGSLVRNSGTQPSCLTAAQVYGIPVGTGAFALSILCFIISVWIIAGVLVSLPAAVTDIQEKDKVWDRRTTLWLIKLELWRLVVGQFVLFGVGICSFGAGVVVMLLTC